MDDQTIKANIAALLKRVRLSAEKSQRVNPDILVLAVSKNHTSEAVKAAYSCGLRDFGENYLQEALAKIDALSTVSIRWHFIGPIQSNKTRAIAENFDWVHTADREKIVRRLSDQRPQSLPDLNLCLQVNISGEESKSGVTMGELPDLVKATINLPRVTLRGLMAIPAPSNDRKTQESAFATLREAFEAAQSIAPSMDTLSMGMSNDMEAAIAQGSTIVRIGTAIFGPRNG
ncbi:MAG: YggS family pyridoxal phosphate-dependent enzyme [Pseudomonadota bacterium]